MTMLQKEKFFLEEALQKRKCLIDSILRDDKFVNKIHCISEEMIRCIESGNKILFCGNGGSAADCQHIVAEFIVKLSNLRRSLPAIALTANNSIITAISNDFNYDYIFVRQLEGLAKPGDIFIGLSTSGNSQNIINAVEYANNNKLLSISVTGNKRCKLSEIAQESIIIPTSDTQLVQEIYLMSFHIICETIDNFYLSR